VTRSPHGLHAPPPGPSASLRRSSPPAGWRTPSSGCRRCRYRPQRSPDL